MSDVPNTDGTDKFPLDEAAGHTPPAQNQNAGDSNTVDSPPSVETHAVAGAMPASGDDSHGSPAADEAAAAGGMSAIDQEVQRAMEGMNAGDLAELSSGLPSAAAGADVQSSADLVRGAVVTGTVSGVSGDDVFIEFGGKSQAVIPARQFDTVPQVGETVEATIDRTDDGTGLATAHIKGAVQKASWDTVEVGTTLEGRVTGLIKGGLEVSLNGLRGFMPASQADLSPMKDISVLLNAQVRVDVMEVDRRAKNLLVSRRKVMERERSEKRQEVLEDLAVGQTRKGVVGNLTDFGAFVDLGGVDGLVHKRDLSYSMVDNVADIVKPGDQVEVKVLKIDRDRDRISLGLKQALPDPWEGVGDRYSEGTHLKARVVRLADFGAFAEIETGVEALIPISEMGWSRVRKASDAVSVGDVVDCSVMRVEPKRRRIALSMKQAQSDPWENVLESFEPKSIVKGKVTRLADFGVFVEITSGVEGLIHISELADRRVRSCDEVVSVGDEVETRVLGVDKENRRISLSIRQVSAMDEVKQEEAAVADTPHVPKKRKKPLRGGLSSHFDW